MSLMYILYVVIKSVFDLYSGIILIYVLMSWLPVHNGGTLAKIYAALGTICDPYLDLFRRIIPPIAMIDFSPVVALIALQLVERILLAVIF